MAIKARETITIIKERDVNATWRFYRIASSTSTPSQPTEAQGKAYVNNQTVPSGWSISEPAYDGTSTNSLYTCDLTSFTDGGVSWSVVSKSSSYEAAKQAYNEAQNAKKTATNYLSSDATGIMVADMRNGTETPSTVTTRNVFIDSDSVDIRKGRTILATFGTEVSIRTETGTELAHFGYADSNSESSTSNAPYYTFGYRNNAYLNYTSDRTYRVGDKVKYQDEFYVCVEDITEPESFTSSHWLKIVTPRIGSYSMAEGYDTMAIRMSDHAEGRDTIAQGSYAHAEGYCTVAGTESANTALGAHAEGMGTVALESNAHAEGYHTRAVGHTSHAGGYYTVADKSCQTAIGKYNTKGNTGCLFVVGNGNSTKRSDAFAVYDDGRIFAPFFAGFIQMYAGETAPSGWLICDGRALSRTVYKTLFDVIGTTYGAGDGSTTFNIPDLRDRMPIGAGNSYARNAKAGATSHHHTTGNFTLGVSHIPAHTHGKSGAITSGITSSGAHTHTFKTQADYAAKGTKKGIYSESDGTWSGTSVMTSTGAHTHNLPAHEHTSVGGGQAHNHGNTGDSSNMPPYIGINFIICTGEMN